MKRYNSGPAILLAIAVSSIEINAQSVTHAGFEVSAGVTQLNREASALHRNGSHGQIAALLPFKTALSDAFRLELAYHSIPGKPSPASTIPNAGLVITSLEALKEVVRVRTITAYAIGGAGSYRLDQGNGRESHLGINGGGGISMPVGKIHVFVEGRFHQVFTGEPNGFWPFSFGLRF